MSRDWEVLKKLRIPEQKTLPANFLFPEAAASKIYRAKFRDAMKAAELDDAIDSSVWQQHWQVDVLPVGNGRAALKYLAPYAFRVAISDNRIESVTPSHVTYRYTPTSKKRSVTKTVTGAAFTRRFSSAPPTRRRVSRAAASQQPATKRSHRSTPGASNPHH